MILATANKAKRLLHLSFIGEVNEKQLRESEEDLRALLRDFDSGFRLLTDLDRLESMESSCAEEIGRLMELFKETGIEMVVRVIPNSRTDIGFNILSVFHYGRGVKTVTCETIVEAARALHL